MAVLLREFATWTLQDLMLRKRQDDRVTFQSNHVFAQYPIPVRLADEPAEQFAARKERFWKSLRRRSDLSERLALAFEAFRRSGEQTYSAAHDILLILRDAPAQKRTECERQGIGYAYKPIESALGTTQRGHRKQRKRRGISKDERQIESIRTQASRFIRNHRDFDALFSDRLKSFREAFRRDAEWYADVETSYLERVAEFEKIRGPFEWWSAMPLPATARLYHEQRKFSHAIVYYQRAIEAARRATMHADLRDFVIAEMQRGIELCLHSANAAPMPAYAGPWLPQNHPASPPNTQAA